MLGVALCETAAGEFARAAQLHGAVDEQIASGSEVLEPVEAGLRDKDHTALRAALGDVEFTRHYEAGRAIPIANAQIMAIQDPAARRAAESLAS